MEKLRDLHKFISGPEHVSQFQNFCGVVPLKNPEVHVQQNSVDHDEGVHKNGVIHRHQNGYKKLELDPILKKNGLIVNGDCVKDSGEVLSTNGIRKDLSTLQRTNGYSRKIVDRGSNSEKDDLEKPYIVKSKFLYYLFCFGASLGNEMFYLTFFPFLLWNVDSRLAREMVIVWHWAMYIGQALKDIVKWPRPASPPVFKLEERYEQEYGMPSTHATVGAVIPFSILIISSKYYQFPFMIGVVIAVLWTLLVCCSRIYLGMHTILDILAGLLLACIIMPATLPFVGVIDEFQTQQPVAAFITVFGAFMLCYVYPTQYKWSTTKGDTANVHAISSGIAVGTLFNFQLGLTSPSNHTFPLQVQIPTLNWLLCSILCLLVGTVLLVGIRAIVKPSSIRLVCYLYGIDRKDIPAQRRHGAEVPVRFLTYHFVSIGAACLAPVIFSYLGVLREGYYTEV